MPWALPRARQAWLKRNAPAKGTGACSYATLEAWPDEAAMRDARRIKA